MANMDSLTNLSLMSMGSLLNLEEGETDERLYALPAQVQKLNRLLTATRQRLHELSVEFGGVLDSEEVLREENSTLRDEVKQLKKQLKAAAETTNLLNKSFASQQLQHSSLLGQELGTLKHDVKGLAVDVKQIFGGVNEVISSALRQVGRFQGKGIDDSSVKQLRLELEQERHAKEQMKDRYRAAFEERRRIHNALQDLKGNVRVFCRIRPLLEGECGSMSEEEFGVGHRSSGGRMVNAIDALQLDSRGNIRMVREGKLDHGQLGEVFVADPKTKAISTFAFDAVFGPEAGQADLFEESRALLTSALDGYNVCMFAYGQTGSGKTHTMLGTASAPGIVKRSLEELFKITATRGSYFRVKQWVGCVEVYNEEVFDMLKEGEEAKEDGGSRKLATQVTRKGVTLPGQTWVRLRDIDSAEDILRRAMALRRTSKTKLNNRSSRSHLILTIRLHCKNTVTATVTDSLLHFIDLAGSERVKVSKAEGAVFQEAVSINKSLSALGQVFAAIARRAPHIPYRNSKLTELLQESLGGQAKATMVACVSPDVGSIHDTLSSLAFASRVNEAELGRAQRQIVNELPRPPSSSSLKSTDSHRSTQRRGSNVSTSSSFSRKDLSGRVRKPLAGIDVNSKD